MLPAWYGPDRHPAIPLVISPHGRGVDGAYNLRFWDDVPADGPFALVSPDGQGRRLPLYSWGYGGQIDDLARMPELARAAFPWLELDGRTYAIGSSMGAQESLLLLARRDIYARRGRRVRPGHRHGRPLPEVAAHTGRAPAPGPGAYRVRRVAGAGPAGIRLTEPRDRLRAIARPSVPLQLWWSHADAVVTDQAHQSGAFLHALRAIASRAPVHEIVGYWQHAHEFHPADAAPGGARLFPPRSGGAHPRARLHQTADGTLEELPPRSGRAEVPFTQAFCG